MILEDLQEKLFRASIRHKKFVIAGFIFIYSLLFVNLLLGQHPLFSEGDYSIIYYDLGVWLGRGALFMLSLTVIPGILGRLKIKIPVSFIITRYRRQFGITVFLLALSHFLIVYIYPQIGGLFPLRLIPRLLFAQFGLMALILLLPLFLPVYSSLT